MNKVETTTECPRARSAMTPCYLRDGDLAVGYATEGWGEGRRETCVGCGWGIAAIESAPRE